MMIKVCGMRDRDNVSEVAALHPYFMGFIYYPKSPRHIGDMDAAVVKSLPKRVMPVLVTVDMPAEQILEFVDRYGFRGVQLHGDESPDKCRELRSRGLYVLKAMPMSDSSSVAALEPYRGTIDLLVLDTATPGKGGSGRKFNWSLIDGVNFPADFLLSGGIGTDDATSIAQLHHPQFAGVDLNSRFETTPGIKSATLLHQFMQSLKTI